MTSLNFSLVVSKWVSRGALSWDLRYLFSSTWYGYFPKERIVKTIKKTVKHMTSIKGTHAPDWYAALILMKFRGMSASEVRMSGSEWISGWRSSDETLFSDLQLGGNKWKQSAMFSERAEGLRAAMYSRFWYRLSTGRPWTQSQLFLSQTIHLALDQRNLVMNIEYDDVHRVISCAVRLYLVPLGRPLWSVIPERHTSVYFWGVDVV